MRDSSSPLKDDKKSTSQEKTDGKLTDATASTDISPEKTANPQPVTNPNTEDISPEGLLKVISQEWENELERIK